MAQGLLSGKYGFDNVPQDLRANFGIFNYDSLRRAPDILKVLNDFYESHLDFNVPVFLDSPLAIKASIIYKKYLSINWSDSISVRG